MKTVSDIMTTRLVTIQRTGDVRLAEELMLWGGFHHLPVLDDGRLVGIVNSHDITRARMQGCDSGTTIDVVMSDDVEVASRDDSVSSIAKRMVDRRITSLPVMEDGKLVGIVTNVDVLAAMSDIDEEASERDVPPIRQIMSKSPSFVRADTLLPAAVAEMVSRDVRHLPVVDENRVLVGMLSDRDVRARLGNPLAALRSEHFMESVRITVREVMSADPITVHMDEPIDSLAWPLLHDRVGAVPVVDDEDKLVGIVSYVDVVQHGLRLL